MAPTSTGGGQPGEEQADDRGGLVAMHWAQALVTRSGGPEAGGTEACQGLP